MDEYHLTKRREYQIRLARKITAMKPKTESETMHHRTDHQFRVRVAASDSPHVFATLGLCNLVHEDIYCSAAKQGSMKASKNGSFTLCCVILRR